MSKKTRLFHTLVVVVVVVAATTGGTIATITAVTVGTIIAGCSQSGATNHDMQLPIIDMGPPRDTARGHD